MTEPPPGAGSDPSALRTTARRVDGGWVVDGEKWLITGADGAAFTIVMARNAGPGAAGGATMFLVDADKPGFTVGDHLNTIDATGSAATAASPSGTASCPTTGSSGYDRAGDGVPFARRPRAHASVLTTRRRFSNVVGE